MADFEVSVVKIESKENHPNADRLTIYKIGGYNCISNKLEDGSDRYNIGDYVAYIPADAVLPEWLLKKMDFWDTEKGKGTLSGTLGNRVKPIRLRGVFSEGLLYPLGRDGSKITLEDEKGFIYRFDGTVLGLDVAPLLGIVKYIQPVPVGSLQTGELFVIHQNIVVPYDIEPIQKHMDSLKDGETVEFTEKIHGTQTRFIFAKHVTNENAFGSDKNIYIASKGQGNKGLFFKNNEKAPNIYYVRAFLENNIEEKVKKSNLYKENDMITLFGETLGMQDLKYGLKNGAIGYRLFDVYVGNLSNGRYLTFEECKAFAEETGIERVPSLYVGEYSLEKVNEYTSGKTMLGSDVNQIREGIVIRPLNERVEHNLGRVIVKSVSEDYKLRKGNTTEYD